MAGLLITYLNRHSHPAGDFNAARSNIIIRVWTTPSSPETSQTRLNHCTQTLITDRSFTGSGAEFRSVSHTRMDDVTELSFYK